MQLFSNLDLIALAWFVVAWFGYALVLEMTPYGQSGLNGLMHRYRSLWMERMLAREARMVDGQVIAGLQNGTAFFASTSLIALGGSVTLLHSTEDMLTIIAKLPFGEAVTHEQWEIKVVGLMIIFIYAFFKFAWSYRLYNYVGILVGAAPPASERDEPEAKAYARSAALVITDAGRHFNRGQRAFFFALGYLGWFLGPLPLIATTAAVLVVMWRRQFVSRSHRAIRAN
ncbi:MAG TPA: DUF599 domain-containing protein [Xanthobacteraceae bacterium]|jgi:uncharacterized membrane protein|nr:DUF599 domain-containing protein [Xanthobacteraceae bacterium]